MVTQRQLIERYPSLFGKLDDDTPLLFNDILLRDQPLPNDDIQRTNTENDDKKLSAKLKEIVAAMIFAVPSLHPQPAAPWLLHTPQGKALLSQHKKDTAMPQIDIMKVIAITEDAMMAQAKLDKRVKPNGKTETDAEAFSRRYETDIDFRKQDRYIRETRQLMALAQTKKYPNLMSLVPVSVETGSTEVSDDSEKAYTQAMKLAEEQHRLAPTLTVAQHFARWMEDPANVAQAGRVHRRPGQSSTSGDELQR